MSGMTMKSVKDRTGSAGLPETAFRELVRVYGLLGRIMQPYFARFGISGPQYGMLRSLFDAHDQGLTGLRLTDLSDRLLVRPPSVTGVVDRLQRMGLVTREPSVTDMRAKEVRLTESGCELVKSIAAVHSQQIESLMDGLDAAEQKQFHRLLTHLSLHLETMADATSRRS
jgi:DNA-binding MarR family transcriptional regulator